MTTEDKVWIITVLIMAVLAMVLAVLLSAKVESKENRSATLSPEMKIKTIICMKDDALNCKKYTFTRHPNMNARTCDQTLKTMSQVAAQEKLFVKVFHCDLVGMP